MNDIPLMKSIFDQKYFKAKPQDIPESDDVLYRYISKIMIRYSYELEDGTHESFLKRTVSSDELDELLNRLASFVKHNLSDTDTKVLKYTVEIEDIYMDTKWYWSEGRKTK